MAALIVLALASAAAAAPAPQPDLVGRWAPFIREAAGRAAIPERWIRRVIRAESAGRTRLGGLPITSRAGAMGLMQLMPATWAAMRARLRLGADPYDPHDNIVAGAAFLRLMYDRFGYPGLFGAYNAGPARYAAYLRGRALPPETVAYLRAAAEEPAVGFDPTPSSVSGAVALPRPTLFVALRARDPSGDPILPLATQPQPARRAILFAVRHVAPGAAAGSPAPEGGD